MTLFTDELHRIFAERGREELYNELSSTYDDLLTRKLDALPLPDDNISPSDHAKLCCFLCQQALLHRAIRLFEASIISLSRGDVYATTLCIRGHYEATASMGHVYNRIMSLIDGNITLLEFHERLAQQILGSREIAQAPAPINIMTMIEKADKALNRYIFDGEEKNMLADCYEFLCEFAHANFHSYSVALEVDRENGVMRLRYDQSLRDEEFGLIGHIDLSNKLFVDLFDRFGACVEQIEA
jgi:hypothetical protein